MNSNNNEMIEILEGQYQSLVDAWYEVEDILVLANKQTSQRLEDNDDDELLAKLSAVSLFVSRVQYIFHKKLKAITDERARLEERKTMRGDIKIPVGK